MNLANEIDIFQYLSAAFVRAACRGLRLGHDWSRFSLPAGFSQGGRHLLAWQNRRDIYSIDKYISIDSVCFNFLFFSTRKLLLLPF